jgi:hypothetical protein
MADGVDGSALRAFGEDWGEARGESDGGFVQAGADAAGGGPFASGRPGR